MHIGETDDYDLGSVFLPDQTSLTYADGTYSDYFYGSNGGNTVCLFGGNYSYGSQCRSFRSQFLPCRVQRQRLLRLPPRKRITGADYCTDVAGATS